MRVFRPLELKGLTLRNRLVRSATYEGMATPEGAPTERLVALYRELAVGGVGLIVTGNAFVCRAGRGGPGCLGIHEESLLAPHAKLTESVKEAGGIIFIQLLHSGSQLPVEHLAGLHPVAPSAVPDRAYPGVIPRQMSREEITRTIEDFAAAAKRAKIAGYHGVQLHAAHGYLLAQFRSPHSNRRDDEYGGSPEKRDRFVIEVYEAVREAVGEDYPVAIKLNARDYSEPDIEIKDTLRLVRELVGLGIDMIEVSGGVAAGSKDGTGPVRRRIRPGQGEAYFLDDAIAVKHSAGDVPVSVVGGIRSPETAERALAHGLDLVSLSRPLIREPDLPKRWQSGYPKPSRCISCNRCFILAGREGLACYQEIRERRLLEKRAKRAAS